MQSVESLNEAVIRRYFDGCNSGDLAELRSTLTDDVVHYFLAGTFRTIRGAEHLASFWRKYKLRLNPTWRIDELIVAGDRGVSEWSCEWTVPASGARLMNRGSEWYVLRDGRIAEVRAYFQASDSADSELVDFPYASRGYLAKSNP